MGRRRVKVFVDTSALYALMVAEDLNHQAVQSCFEQLKFAEAALISTNYVLLECISLIQRRHGLEVAKAFLAEAALLLDVVWIEKTQHERAVALWSKSGRRTLSLVDCASFLVMREHGLRCAVACDVHFTEAGFEVLPRADRVSERRGVYRTSRVRRKNS